MMVLLMVRLRACLSRMCVLLLRPALLWGLPVLVTGFVTAVVPRTAAAEQPVVLYGDDDYPPYSYLQGDVPRGLYVQILQAAFARLPDYSLIIRLVPWRRGLKMLEHGEAVGMFPPYRREEERPFIGAYSVPLATESVAVYCTEAVADQVAGKPFPSGYAGLTFGNNAGFKVGGPEFEAMREHGAISVIEISGTDINLKMLLAGRVQCYANDRLAIRLMLRDLGIVEGHGLREVAVVRQEAAYVAWSGVALRAQSWLPELARQLDSVLAEMRADGSLDRISGLTEDRNGTMAGGRQRSAGWSAGVWRVAGAVLWAAVLPMVSGATPAVAMDLACPDFAPFKMTGIPDSRPGVDVEVLQSVFTAIGEPIRFQPMPWKRGLEMARAGRVDGLCGCSYLPEREQEFLFSDVLGEHHQGLFTRREDGDDVVNLTVLKGAMVGVVRGYALQKDLTDAGIQVMEVVDDAQLVRVLASGRVRAAYTYRDVFRYHARQMAVGEVFAYHDIRMEPYYLCLSRTAPKVDSVMDRFNQGLKDLQQQGGYRRIWDSYGIGS